MALPERARATEGSMAAAAVGPMALRVAAEAVHRTFASPRFIKSSIPAVVSLLLPAGAAAAALGAAGTLLVDQAATLARRERKEQAEIWWPAWATGLVSVGRRRRRDSSSAHDCLATKRSPAPAACLLVGGTTPSSRTCVGRRSARAARSRRGDPFTESARSLGACVTPPAAARGRVAGYSFPQRGCRVASPRPLATLVV